MAINPSAPRMPEMDISLLSGTGQFVPNSPGYPEIDITLLPGVPAVSTTFIKETAVAATSYRHVQNAAATTWTINHNLKFRPNVTVFDSGNTMVEGNVVHVSINQLTIQFSAAISGTALLS
jgi:putative salt-induced outer membrane protein YdiY